MYVEQNEYIDQITAKQLHLRNKIRGSVLRFGKAMMPTFFYLPPSPMHYDFDSDLQDPECLRLNYEAPRKHAKTTFMARAYPLQALLESGVRGKKEYIVLIGKTQKSVAQKSLYALKYQLMYNERIRELYGDWGKNTAIRWSNEEIILKNNSTITTKGLDQPVTGLVQLEQRPTIVVLDDVQDLTNTKTETAMRFTLRWLLGEIDPAMQDGGRIVNIATPKHELALVEELKKDPAWKSRTYDSLLDEGLKTERMLWPEGFSREKLKQKESSAGSLNELRTYYREYRCQLVGSEEQLFRPEYFRYYRGTLQFDPHGNPSMHITHLWRKGDPEPIQLDVPDIRPVATFTGIDPASSQSERSAYSAIVTIAVDAQLNMFILPYFKKRVPPSALVAEIVKRNSTYMPTWTTIEENGYQVAVKDQLRNLDGIFIPGLRQKHITRDPKDTRHERLEPYFYQGKIFFLEDMAGIERELLLYPRGTRDLMDGLEFATTRFHAPSHIISVQQYTTKHERLGKVVTYESFMGIV